MKCTVAQTRLYFQIKHFLHITAELGHLQGTYICDNEVGLLLVCYCNVQMCIKHQYIVDINI